jgi:peptide-methionine (S)-S-oxide reductase
MSMSLSVLAVLSLMLPVAGLIACNTANASSTALPAAELDAALASTHGQQSAVVAGGCFWGIQAVFQHVKGVISAVSGYAGGSAQTADYEKVCGGNTGHAESVKVTYDPAQISYGQILRIFFSVAHDPTELNRQGPDSGTQYRSAIFYDGEEQKRVAEAYIAQLDRASIFPRRIVTQVTPLVAFYPAEDYHQNYAANHPSQPYIMFNDAPKVVALRKLFPELYTEDEKSSRQ